MFSPAWKQYLAGLAAAFGAACLGASGGWSSPVESKYKDESSGYPFIPNDNEWGWISSILTLGSASMCVPIGFLIAKFGRKITMLVVVLPFLIGWTMIGFARNVYMVYCGRFIIGACGGSFGVTAPIYTTEVAEVDKRGSMGCFFHLLVVHGVLYSFVCGAFLELKLVNALCGILPLVFFIIFIWMPESPIFLIQKGKQKRAEKAMRFLRGKDADFTAELNNMIVETAKEQTRAADIICRKSTLKGIFISIMLMVFQQFTGINAIVFYSTEIFESAKTGISGNLCTILLGIVMVLATIMATMLIDRIGRKIILLCSALVMSLSTLVMASFYQWLQSKNIGLVAVLSILIFIIAFSLGFGPVPFLLMAELFAEDAKPVAGSIVCTTCWIFAFCVTKLFPIGVSAFGQAVAFGFFATFSFLAFIFVLIFVPETKGKTLSEIQGILEG